jgi:hypothetical protein
MDAAVILVIDARLAARRRGSPPADTARRNPTPPSAHPCAMESSRSLDIDAILAPRGRVDLEPNSARRFRRMRDSDVHL